MRPRISVIVPTCRRPDLLDRCLAALAAQTLLPQQYEVIVADDGAKGAWSDPLRSPAAQVVRRWKQQAKVQITYLPVVLTQGPAAARNAAVRVSHGEILAFTDDDCVPEPDWLEEGLKYFVHGVHAAWGRITMPLPPVPTDYERCESGLETAGFVTANCFCRRDAFIFVGGFDEQFRTAWREDSALFFAFLRAGMTVVPAPTARIVHPVRPAPWGVSLKMQKKSMFDALLFKKYSDLYRKWVRPGVPVSYYLIVGSVLACIAALALDEETLALASFALYLVTTGIFIGRRLSGTRHNFSHVTEMIVTSLAIPWLSVFWRLYGALRFRVLFW